MEEMVWRFELPATFSPLNGTLGTPLEQLIPSVPKATHDFSDGRSVQVEPMLFTLGHNLNPAVGNVKFSGTEDPGWTGFVVIGGVDPGGENPAKPLNESKAWFGSGSRKGVALGSNATTQHDPPPLPPPLRGSPKVTEAALYERKRF